MEDVRNYGYRRKWGAIKQVDYQNIETGRMAAESGRYVVKIFSD